MIRVRLKRLLDRSPKVPSWLKWYSHQAGSLAVAMAVIVPNVMKSTSRLESFGVVIDETEM